MSEVYAHSANLRDYCLFLFVPGPLLYISLPCFCHIHVWCQLPIFFLSVNKGGNHNLFLDLSVPGVVPRCSASTLVLLAGFLNSVK